MAAEENCIHGNKFHTAGEEPGLRAGRRKGQVGGLFIPSFNALTFVPFSPPSQTHFPFFFFLLSILSFQSSSPQPSGDNESHLESTLCVSGAGYSS